MGTRHTPSDMKLTLALLFVALPALAFAGTNLRAAGDDMVLSDNLIDEVNRARSTWVAGRNVFFENKTMGDVEQMMGTDLNHGLVFPPLMTSTLTASGLPKEFDARTQWSDCIHPIRNQGQCGSCWAFGASEVLSDRLCIATAGKKNVVLSPQDMVSCDTMNHGCQGGNLQYAWSYLERTGVVSDACLPYQSGSSRVDGKCPADQKCVDGSKGEKVKAVKGSTTSFRSVEAIMESIMTHGPVEAGFRVYRDFMSYKSGVYQHVSGGLAGGHAIKVIGWGTEDGTDYWLVANSWGTEWGLDGLFKIRRGNDEC